MAFLDEEGTLKLWEKTKELIPESSEDSGAVRNDNNRKAITGSTLNSLLTPGSYFYTEEQSNTLGLPDEAQGYPGIIEVINSRGTNSGTTIRHISQVIAPDAGAASGAWNLYVRQGNYEVGGVTPPSWSETYTLRQTGPSDPIDIDTGTTGNLPLERTTGKLGAATRIEGQDGWSNTSFRLVAENLHTQHLGTTSKYLSTLDLNLNEIEGQYLLTGGERNLPSDLFGDETLLEEPLGVIIIDNNQGGDFHFFTRQTIYRGTDIWSRISDNHYGYAPENIVWNPWVKIGELEDTGWSELYSNPNDDADNARRTVRVRKVGKEVSMQFDFYNNDPTGTNTIGYRTEILPAGILPEKYWPLSPLGAEELSVTLSGFSGSNVSSSRLLPGILRVDDDGAVYISSGSSAITVPTEYDKITGFGTVKYFAS